jgi:hypothetical protein
MELDQPGLGGLRFCQMTATKPQTWTRFGHGASPDEKDRLGLLASVSWSQLPGRDPEEWDERR